MSVAVADINADGQPDLVAGDYSATAINVLLGAGKGTFRSLPSLNPGGIPYSVALADMDNDGRLDLVAGTHDTSFNGSVMVMKGNNTGYFRPYATNYMGTYATPSNIRVADFNGDGQLDIVAAVPQRNAVAVFLHVEFDTFRPVVFYPTGANQTSPGDVAVGDVNGDGKPDLVASNSYSYSVAVLLGMGTGGFRPAQELSAGKFSVPQSVALADLNQDGNLDIVVVNDVGFSTTGSVGVLLGTGAGNFKPVVTYQTGDGSYPRRVVVRDIDGDGALDLITANTESDTAGVLLGRKDGTFSPVVTFSTGVGGYPDGLAVADVNGDGRPDIIAANNKSNTLGVLLNTTATFLPARPAVPAASLTLTSNPVPAGASFTFATNNLAADVRLLDLTVLGTLGQVLRRLTVVPSARIELSTAGLAPGIYLLHTAILDAQGQPQGTLPMQRLCVD